MNDIDYTPLTTEPDARDVARWRESVRRHDEAIGHHGPASGDGGGGNAAPAWVGVAFIWWTIVALICTVAGWWILLSEGATSGLIFGLGAPVLWLLSGWLLARSRVQPAVEGWTEPYQLMAFARANGLESVPVTGPSELRGRIFGRGLAGNRVRHDLVAWTQDGRQAEVATESWHSGNPPGGGRPKDAGSCRYLAVQVGDVPEDSVVTEEMQRLLDDPAQPREAEVVDGWFLAYDFGDPDPLDVGDWQRSFALARAVSAAVDGASRRG